MIWVSVALAQGVDAPVDVERFYPPVDRFGYGVTESASTLGHLQLGFAAWGGYESAPVSPLVRERSAGVVQAGFGLGRVFSLVIAAPVGLWQSGDEALTPSGFGDLRLTPKISVLRVTEGRPVGLAVLATATIPTAASRSLLGEGGPTVAPVLVAEVADGDVDAGEYLTRVALNVGGRIKSADALLDEVYGSELVFRAAIAAKPADLLEMGVDVAGAFSGPDDTQAPVELLPWARVGGGGAATLTVGAGVPLRRGLGAPAYRVYGGVQFAPKLDPAALDRDDDGIPNKFDACLDDPEDADGFRDDDGCPDDDNDGDTVPDASDACPDDPEDADGHADADGCPDPDDDGDGVLDAADSCDAAPEDADGFQDYDGCPEADNDADGVPDGADRCPNSAENVNGLADADGCPEDVVDTDGDGLHDGVDACPYGAEDLDGFEDGNGCPDPDNDSDGVLDRADRCPFEPENDNDFEDDDGCPDDGPRVELQREKIVIREKVYFEYDRAVIQRMSFELLDEVAQVILDHPEVTRIQVEGHTDGDGPEAYNTRLSQDRAQAVVEYLVGEGVARERLVAQGFGESVPIDTNETTEGKARNRRVEFTVLGVDAPR